MTSSSSSMAHKTVTIKPVLNAITGLFQKVSSLKERNTMKDKKNEVSIELDHSKEVKKYMNFKKFDIVQDYSDHYYSKSNSSSWQESEDPPRNWAKKIQEEWRILERDLPDKIYVRVYEERMDLLRAVIIGVEGTPYCDGLFFFDVCFPKSYPNAPPQVHYRSGGLRINPNLYNNGRVCLSLLNTWFGVKNEKWRPVVSTMLQVLVSIQGMILNAKPYFNEPGYQIWSGSDAGEKWSQEYNQRILVYTLKTMVYSMNKPPKNFEDLVIDHFSNRASGILATCKVYYTKGVGVKYGISVCDKSCRARKQRKEVELYMKTLVGAFKHIGIEGVDDFVPLTKDNTIQLQKGKKNLIQKIMSWFDIKKARRTMTLEI